MKKYFVGLVVAVLALVVPGTPVQASLLTDMQAA